MMTMMTTTHNQAEFHNFHSAIPSLGSCAQPSHAHRTQCVIHIDVSSSYSQRIYAQLRAGERRTRLQMASEGGNRWTHAV